MIESLGSKILKRPGGKVLLILIEDVGYSLVVSSKAIQLSLTLKLTFLNENTK